MVWRGVVAVSAVFPVVVGVVVSEGAWVGIFEAVCSWGDEGRMPLGLVCCDTAFTWVCEPCTVGCEGDCVELCAGFCAGVCFGAWSADVFAVKGKGEDWLATFLPMRLGATVLVGLDVGPSVEQLAEVLGEFAGSTSEYAWSEYACK